MGANENEPIADKIIEGLKNAIVEIEEFRLQMTLGKYEARDLYEDAKKKFGLKVHELKIKMETAKEQVDEKIIQIKSTFEALQVQLALGKAETKEVFENQRKNILGLLHELEVQIKSNKTSNEYYEFLQTEIEKFKIKLNILSLNYELKKFEVADDFEKKKNEFQNKIEGLKGKLHLTNESKVEHFRKEMAAGYEHLKKAFSF